MSGFWQSQLATRKFTYHHGKVTGRTQVCKAITSSSCQLIDFGKFLTEVQDSHLANVSWNYSLSTSDSRSTAYLRPLVNGSIKTPVVQQVNPLPASWHLIWVSVHVLATPLSLQLSAHGLGKKGWHKVRTLHLCAPLPVQFTVVSLRKAWQQKIGQVLGLLHACGKPKRSSWLWAPEFRTTQWVVNQDIEKKHTHIFFLM